MHHIDVPEWAYQRGRELRAPYQLVPVSTAAIVVDLQRFFTVPGQAMANDHAPDVIRNTNRITSALRAAGGTIVFTKQWSKYEDPRWSTRCSPTEGTAKAGSLRGALQPGSWEFELHDDVEVAPGDISVTKHRPSAFHPYADSGLLPLLEKRGIEAVIITGLLSTGCCLLTATDAYQYNFRVAFVADATATATDQEHNAVLLNLACWFGDIEMTDDLVHRLAPAAEKAGTR